MTTRQAITLLCGGQSVEHEISILSARNIYTALNKKKYDVSVVYVSQQGTWNYLNTPSAFLKAHPTDVIASGQSDVLWFAPGHPEQPWRLQHDSNRLLPVDCVIPMLHGTQGEDGTLQGFLEILNVAYVGCGVLASALCMEKHMTKRLLRYAGLPTVDWLRVDVDDMDQFPYAQIVALLGEIVFIKPANLGSSVGISKVKTEQEYEAALRNAFQFDDQVIIETFVSGREIECSVLGNHDPVASLPGEVVTQHEFYSYEAKYLDPNGARCLSPADLSPNLVETVQQYALKAYRVLQCSGMARVDFFLTENNDVLINELNPMPGFASMSLYPKNWEASGVTFSKLMDDLIQLAVARHHRKQTLSHVFSGVGELNERIRPSKST